MVYHSQIKALSQLIQKTWGGGRSEIHFWKRYGSKNILCITQNQSNFQNCSTRLLPITDVIASAIRTAISTAISTAIINANAIADTIILM